jgi:hypothetical protein
MTQLTLIQDWRRIMFKLWSVRLALIAALLSALACGVSIYEDGRSWMVSGIVFVVNIASGFSRVVAQPGLFEGEHDRRRSDNGIDAATEQ